MKILSLRDSLEVYNTSNSNDIKLLDTIYKKVSRDYTASSVNSFKINKILQAYNDFEYVLKKFEFENLSILDDIKRYVMRANVNDDKVKEIETRMKEWALFFTNRGIEDSILEHLINRYRKDFVTQYTNLEKKELRSKIYIEYLFLIKDLWNSASNEEQIKVLEEFKGKNNRMVDIIISYLLDTDKENELTNKHVNISRKYIDNLMNKDFLLRTIKDLTDILAKSYNYADYIEDLQRIYFVLNNIFNWIDINKLYSFISEKKLNVLKELQLVSEIKKTDIHLIKLTELGYSLALNEFYKEWESDKYFYELDKEVFIPYDANPFIISKYIFNKQFSLKERDYLIIFERTNLLNA